MNITLLLRLLSAHLLADLFLQSDKLLLAAKSVFRFGDLNKAKEIKITEYVLLGTLASFTIALLVAFALTRIKY